MTDSFDLINFEMSLGMSLQEIGLNPNLYIQRMRMLQPELVLAYLSTRYCFNVDGEAIVLQIDIHSNELEEYLSSQGYKSWAFVSAYNPYSEELSDQENIKRHNLLKKILEELGHSFIEGEGVSEDERWHEPSFFIPEASIQLGESLGILFKQNAILYGELGSEPLILFCSNTRET